VNDSIIVTKHFAETSKDQQIVSRERSRIEPPPATNGVANAERHDQLPGNGQKNEKPTHQLTDSERQTVFDDFLKWYQTEVSSVAVSVDALRSC
jgi:hypothetical protein